MKPLSPICATLALALAPACQQAESGPTAPITENRSAPDRDTGSREPRRAPDLGVPFDGTLGDWNAITDVPGVQVGHTTLIEGDGASAIRTGVTAILPGEVVRPVFASTFRLNGDGAMTGTHYIEEKGELISPIVLTGTASEGTAHEAVLRWSLSSERAPYPINLPVVAETWDGDHFLAFSTAWPKGERGSPLRRASFLRDDRIDPVFLATVRATEEAIVNALVAAETMVDVNGSRVHALPHDELVDVLRRFDRLETR